MDKKKLVLKLEKLKQTFRRFVVTFVALCPIMNLNCFVLTHAGAVRPLSSV